MAQSPTQFAQLLTEAVHRIRLREVKTIQIVQDELGYEMGRQGGSAVEYWRKGHLPPTSADIGQLARILVQRGSLEPDWLLQFLQSAGYPDPHALHAELFPQAIPPPADNLLLTGIDDGNIAPFIVGPPITHPRFFFGRETELQRIFGLLRRFPLQNVAIVGPRRSGKTSLLHYLRTITATPASQLRPGQFADWLPHPEEYRWVYVDFQDPRMGSEERLLAYLLTQLDLPCPAPCTLTSFMDTLSDRLRTPAIILLDEIGAALSSPSLTTQFWWALRSLQTNQAGGRLSFILAAHDAPNRLAADMDKTSPFFNIFGFTMQLGPLSEKEALELIASSPRPFNEEDVAWILAMSGRWPAPLQALCYSRLAALEEEQAGEGWKPEALNQIAPYQALLNL